MHILQTEPGSSKVELLYPMRPNNAYTIITDHRLAFQACRSIPIFPCLASLVATLTTRTRCKFIYFHMLSSVVKVTVLFQQRVVETRNSRNY